MIKLRNTIEKHTNARIHHTKDGIRTYHYTALNDRGVVAGYVLKVRLDDGTIIEERPMTFDDVAGHSPASKKFGY